MSADVIEFAAEMARRKPKAITPTHSSAFAPGTLSRDFTFWRGATGIRYVHTIYPLFECPELPAANFVLVRRQAGGRAEVVHIGRVEHVAASLNLADIRRNAAGLGANEVHVHLLAETSDERAAIERDLSGAGELTSATRH